MSTNSLSLELAKLSANTIRLLSAEAVQKANSGHPGMPMGMADCAFVLWNRFLKITPQVTDWQNRDRFVLSAGHGSMLLYSLLHLSGYDISVDDLKLFRQLHSKTAGHPEHNIKLGIETTTGPLGQGFSNGIGMAIAAKMMAERFNTADITLFDHHIYAIVSDGDLMEGVSAETASLAGHLKLGNVIYLYDDNQITIEGKTNLAISENTQKRFEAYGWHTIKIDGHNHEQIAAAIEQGIGETDKPTLIIATTHIGYGSPNKQDTSESHGAPLGEDEVLATRKNLNWKSEQPFFVPEEVKQVFHQRNVEMKAAYESWEQKFNQWQKKNPDLAKQLAALNAKKIPENIEQELVKAIPEKAMATRASSGVIIQKVAELVPSLVGGSADLDPSTKTRIKNSESIAANQFGGRNFHFGIREHGMGSILNGMALHSGFIPFGSTFLVFCDYMRPPIRLAAIMRLQIIYVFTHDSIFVGEDGPTHQPIEQITALRTIPKLTVIRPADNLEVAMAWAAALKKQNGPTALMLTRQTVPELDRGANFDISLIQKGGYILSDASNGKPDIIIVGTGSEVSVALECKKTLEQDGHAVRVVSMPCREVFNAQSQSYRETVIPSQGAKIVVVEAGITLGWESICATKPLVIGIDKFGTSGPYKLLAEEYGLTGEKVTARIKAWL